MDQVDRSELTNADIARRVGVTHATISRLRTGTRQASIELMVQIQWRIGWDLKKQVRARRNKTYGRDFEQFLIEHYDDAGVPLDDSRGFAAKTTPTGERRVDSKGT